MVGWDEVRRPLLNTLIAGVVFLLLLTLFIWLASFLFYFFSFESMNIEVDSPHMLIALAAVVVAPPSSPLIIGIFHGAVIAILGTVRLLNPVAATGYAILLHLMQMVIVVAFGLIGLRKMNLSFRQVVRKARGRGGSGLSEDGQAELGDQ